MSILAVGVTANFTLLAAPSNRIAVAIFVEKKPAAATFRPE
jgi:hypothetical protein